MKDYNKSLVSNARKLRKNMTPWESKLWYGFLKNYPVRIQRQKIIGNYIVDFYCAKAKIAIELDGGGHYTDEKISYDNKRTKDIERLGIRTVRICNLDINNSFMRRALLLMLK